MKKGYFSIILIMIISLTSCLQSNPDKIGLLDNKLQDCPRSPNCVITYQLDKVHGIEPLTYDASTEEAMHKVKTIINNMKGTRIITETDNYLHVEFDISIFTDDVEFLFNDATKTIHFRSASRVGYNDFGVNRSRMNKFRKLYLNYGE